MAAPVGDLRLKFRTMDKVVPGFKFLEYYIFLDENEGPIARPLMSDFQELEDRLTAMGPWLGSVVGTVDAPKAPGALLLKDPAKLHADKAECLINWRCSFAAWDGDGYGDAVLIALLSNHFGGDVEELLALIHSRAKQTKLKSMRRFTRSLNGTTSAIGNQPSCSGSPSPPSLRSSAPSSKVNSAPAAGRRPRA